MEDDDIVDDVLSTSVDTFLTPPSTSFISPTVSSGLSSIDDPPSASRTVKKNPVSAAPEDPVTNYTCTTCGKVYSKRSKRHYINHVFLHNISGANTRRPTMEDVIPYIDEYLSEILCEISMEPRISPEKLLLVQEIMKSQGTNNWTRFLIAISFEIVESLSKRVKVMPSHQYEEILLLINRRLNNRTFFNSLKELCQACVSEQCVNSEYLGVVVFRVSFRLCEKIQLLVMGEMRKTTNTSVATVEEVVGTISNLRSSPEEQQAFEGHMSKLVRNYYIKISQLDGPVWSVRAMCIRKEFVVSEAEGFVSHKSMLDPVMWLENTLTLSEKALNFFINVECEIRKVFGETSCLSKEMVMEKITNCPQQLLLNDWCFLTFVYFAEQDALTFMRDILSIVINLSIRLEQKRMLALEQRRKRLPKFSLRGNLKRN